MLNTIDDYNYLRSAVESAEIGISGRIIPYEDVHGLKHPVRRENLAFLHEAISERQARAYSGNLPGKVVSKDGVRSVGESIRSRFTSVFVKPDFDFYDAGIVVTDENTTIEDAYPDAFMSLEDCTIPPYVQSALSATYLRHCFWNVNRLKMTQCLNATGNTKAGTVRVSAYAPVGASGSKRDESGSVELSDDYGFPGGTRITLPSGNYYQLGSRSVYQYFNGFAADEHPEDFAASRMLYDGYLYARLDDIESAKLGEATMIQVFEAIDQHTPTPGSTQTTKKWVYVPVGGTISRETGTLPLVVRGRFDSEIFIQAIRASFGVTPSSDLHTPGYHDYILNFRSVVPIIAHDYRSEIDSLGWAWTPGV